MTNKQNTRPSAHLGGRLYRLSLVLLCLVLLSFHLMSGLFAKYSTTASASDSARVAKFDVNITESNVEGVSIAWPENDQDTKYTFIVVNNSDVAVSCDLALVLKSELPDGVSYSFYTGETSTIALEDNEKITLAPHSQQDMVLDFKIDWQTFTADKTGAAADANISFTVNAVIEQID